MRNLLILFVLLLVAVFLIRTCLYTVDRTEFVYVTQFGRHVHTFDGASETDAGLHVKWPWPIQSVQRLDRRLQYFDLPGAELMTRDRNRNTIDKTLTIDAYVCWRIPDSPDNKAVDQFVRSVGTVDGARAILTQRLGSDLGALIGDMEMSELVSTDSEAGGSKVEARRNQLRKDLLRRLEGAKTDYGVEVVDVRLRRTNHPPSVRDAIYERIRSRRGQIAAEYISDGEKQAKNIASASTRRIENLKSYADAEAIKLRGQADAEADRIRSEAQKQDPDFYALLKKLDAYKKMLGDNKTLLLLSTHREIFDLFNNPPGTKSMSKPVVENEK